MDLKVVLVSPIYAENVGYAARAMANFGFKELALVKPKCKWKCGKARARAMHGKQLLLNAKKFETLDKALADCSYSVATTAKAGKGEKIFRSALFLKDFAKRFGKSKGKVAVVFGSEPNGLLNEEIAECDFVTTIPASGKYATLNLGHAVAVVLYELFNVNKRESPGFKEAGTGKKHLVVEKFKAIEELLPGIENRAAVLASFRSLVARALFSEKEAGALLAFLSESEKGLKKKKPARGKD